MDFEDIGNRLANLTMYDVRKAYGDAVNWAMNVSEIEAKVKEATSDEKWGASSTLMQEIAAATHNFADFNEIMPAIYRNFMEREAKEWRMIYKSLQLLEYIVKHGSERVVDDARSHVGTIKILRNFHYIDEQGKDQGINVRNRSKELSTLLGDVDMIRQERRKARSNKQKYQGAGNGDFVPGSGTGRYGGFGSDSFYAGGGGGGGSSAYGGGSSGYGGGRSGGGGGYDGEADYDEYDAGDAEDRPAPRKSTSAATSSSSAPPPKAAPKAKEVDLLGWDDDEPAAAAAAAAAAPTAVAPAPVTKPAAAPSSALDAFGDDFDDFQAAPTATSAPAPAPRPSVAASLSYSSASSGTLAPTRASSVSKTAASPSNAASKPATAASSSSSGLGGFDDLWASSSNGGASGNAASKQKMTMAEMARNKSSSAVWGSDARKTNVPAAAAGGGGGGAQQQQGQKKPDLFDLL